MFATPSTICSSLLTSFSARPFSSIDFFVFKIEIARACAKQKTKQNLRKLEIQTKHDNDNVSSALCLYKMQSSLHACNKNKKTKNCNLNTSIEPQSVPQHSASARRVGTLYRESAVCVCMCVCVCVCVRSVDVLLMRTKRTTTIKIHILKNKFPK